MPFAAAEGDRLAKRRRRDRGHARARRQGADRTARTGTSPASTRRRSRGFYRFAWTDGSDATLGRLGDDGALVTEAYAEDRGLAVGERLSLQSPSGEKRTVVVRGIYDPPQIDAAARRRQHRAARRSTTRSRSRRTPSRSSTRSRRRRPRWTRPRSASTTRRSTPARASARTRTKELRQLPADALRAAGLLGGREPVRDGQHARALGLRAHARARDAADHRDDAAPGAPHDPPRERDHGADRRGARPPARRVPRRAGHAGAVGLRRGAVAARPDARRASRVVAVLAGVAAAILPARRASGLNVLDALHYE